MSERFQYANVILQILKPLESAMDQLRKGGFVFFLTLCTAILPMWLFGQQTAWVKDSIQIQAGDTITLDHSIVPFQLNLIGQEGDTIPHSQFKIDYSNRLIICEPCQLRDTLFLLSYQYFLDGPKQEISFGRWKEIRDSTSKDALIDLIFEEEQIESTLWNESRIKKSGSLTRGLTLGNQRGVSVTSGLRLQLEGDLGNDLKIIGAITDENIPIQPDGTTQQLNDFDKVFIKLIKKPYQVTIGDYEILQRGTSFANYYRNVQGLQFTFGGEDHQVNLSGAVAKGKFNTNSIQGKEGVAGPYRLSGQNGERFFFVLAGSEKVYLNGKLMKRGEAEDYIIDYNTAEITFTAKNLITSVSRIVVDFEYNDQYYNRTLFVAQTEHSLLNDKLRLKMFYGRDADNPNAPFDDAEAFAEARDSLEIAGDDPNQALTSGIQEVGFSNEVGQLRYLRADTVISGQNYERYVFSTDSSAIYRIFFSFVGTGNGFYVRDNSGVNRTIYKWVPPDMNGEPQGDYAPVRSWVLPRSLQVAGLNLSYDITDNIQLTHESAMSIDDKNRLSSVGDADNIGLAERTDLKWKKIRLSDSLELNLALRQQYVGARYTNLDRLYQAEYNRIWNILPNTPRRNERIGTIKAELDYKQKLQFGWEGGIRNTGHGRQDIRQVYQMESQWPKWLQGIYTLTYLKNQDEPLGRDAKWIRHEADIYQPLGKKWRIGTEIWIEDKEEKLADSLAFGSFSFVDIKPYLRTFESKKFQADISLNYRKEDQYFDGKMREQSKAMTYSLKTTYQPNRYLLFQQTSSFRDFQVLDTAFNRLGLNTTRVVNTQLQGQYRSENRLMNLRFVYDAASEQVARRDIRYVEVNPGQGQFEYLGDLNENGIQDLEEFQISTNPIIANYVRVSIPTRELFPTTKLGLTARLQLDFRNVVEASGGFGKALLRNLRTNTLVRVSQNKTRDSRFQAYIIDLTNILADTNLINASYNFRQDLTLFQNTSKGDLRFTRFETASKLFLSTGDEIRSFSYWGFNQRLNLNSSRSITAETRIGRKFSNAENFDSRNYDIKFVETEPGINFQINRKVRFSAGYAYRFKENESTDEGKRASVNAHSLTANAKINLKERNNLLLKLELTNVKQLGSAGFSGDYELREGLQKGFNAIWQSFLTVYVMGNVELGITYDGRASAVTKVIHSGRIQARAFF